MHKCFKNTLEENMVNQKQQNKKKKQREKLVKAKVLVRRTTLRKLRKEEEQSQRNFDESQTIMHGKLVPIVTNSELLAQRESARSKAVQDKLQHNLEILQALEEEYESEQVARSDMNDKLESEGYKTMREKMDALHKKALELTGKAEPLAQAEKEFAEQQNVEEVVVEPTI